MLNTSQLSTFKFSDPAFQTLENAVKSVCSNKKDSANRKIKVCVGGSANVLVKKSNARDILYTSFPCTNEPSSEQTPANLCADIEYNFSTAINALGECVWDVPSPVWTKKGKISEFVIDANGNKKRFRRKPEDLENEKNHVCPYADCEKAYTSRCSLYLHIKRNHQEDELLKDGEIAPVRINSKVKKGVNIYKVFKPAQAKKFDCGATNLSTAISDIESQSGESKDKTSSFSVSRFNQFEAKSQPETPKKAIAQRKSASAHNLAASEIDMKCELAAVDEIFGWEAHEAIRKASSTSINVQDQPDLFENVIEEQDDMYNDGYAFSYLKHEWIDEEASVFSDFGQAESSNYYSFVNDNESVDFSRAIDLIDLCAKNDESDCNSLFDFEFEMDGVEPRKMLKF